MEAFVDQYFHAGFKYKEILLFTNYREVVHALGTVQCSRGVSKIN